MPKYFEPGFIFFEFIESIEQKLIYIQSECLLHLSGKFVFPSQSNNFLV
jgi:hypothetical protein